MPGPWNDATDRQLLLTIIHLSAPQLPNCSKCAELMGEGFTAESTRQHSQKLRKDCKTKFGNSASAATSDGASPSKNTPRKRKPATGEMPKSTGKRKGKNDAEDAEHDDEENGSPSKKAKAEGDGFE